MSNWLLDKISIDELPEPYKEMANLIFISHMVQMKLREAKAMPHLKNILYIPHGSDETEEGV